MARPCYTLHPNAAVRCRTVQGYRVTGLSEHEIVPAEPRQCAGHRNLVLPCVSREGIRLAQSISGEWREG
jgi:hypothetical protein